MIARGFATSLLWVLIWLLTSIFLILQVADLYRWNIGWPLWVLVAIPILVFLPGIARDNLVWLIWFCLLLLGYFVRSVEAVFAQPDDALVIAILVALSMLFGVCLAYIRLRGRECRKD